MEDNIFITAFTDYNPNEHGNKNLKRSAINALFNNQEFNNKVQELNYRPRRTSQEKPSILEVNQQQGITRTQRIFKRIQENITSHKEQYQEKLEAQYTIFRIPKASGGTRKITAPQDDLKLLLASMLTGFKRTNILEHDSAFAYIEKRSIIDAVQVHQANRSHWFLKLDLTEFFPSFTKEVITEKLNRLHPIHFVDDEVLNNVVEMSLFEGGLPQGSPLSPLLSNLCMVEFDHKLSNELWDYKKQHYAYTRYADDIIISSQYDFNFEKIIKLVTKILKDCNLPHKINKEKTRYGSRAGSNWNLGLMLNKDNNITLGYKKKQRIKATLHCFIADFKDELYWDLQEVQEFLGLLNFAKQVEPEYWDQRIHISEEKIGISMDTVTGFYFNL